MKKTHFRIIELPGYQVLLTKDFSNDEDDEACFLFSITFFFDNMKVVQTGAYKNEESRNKSFDHYSDESAQRWVDSVIKMMN